MPEHTPASGAVFLSYAREDTDAARRIADALRSQGVEVWFDQAELRGGEAWDAKIRQQINDCTIFLPVISKHTQERGKGYFRLEWKLAVEQTHLLADGMAFLSPVVIDDTPESGALVPPEFLRVQWTRLPGALPTPQFVGQVKSLLGGKKMEAGRPRPAARSEGTTPPNKSGLPAWLWGAVVVGVIAVAAFVVMRQPEPTAASAQKSLPPPASSLPPSPAADAKSIAVLPFANLSADKENEFFADGMHDDLITALAKVRDLKVISRTSVMTYKSGERNLKKIAAELGVATVLEGSVQRAGNRVRINLQLIDARTDEHLWAETFNRELTDIFAIQAELVQQVTSTLKATLTTGEQNLLARRPTGNAKAYDLYLRARVLDESSLGPGAARESYERTIGLYEQAIAEDPTFALPHVQASILHGTLYWFRYYDSTPERLARAAAELAKARELAPGAPETRLAEGSFEYTCNNDWRKALEYYHLAEAGLPNNAQLQYRIGLAHRRLGQLPEALERVRRGIALNPNESSGASAYLEILMALRRYAEVIEQAGPIEARFPSNPQLQVFRVRAQFDIDGDWDAYLKRIRAVPAVATDTGNWGKEFGRAIGDRDYTAADRMLAGLLTPIMQGDTTEPVALARSRIAWLQGRLDDARRFALAALDVSRGVKAPPRYQPSLRLDIAEALALAGRVDEAVSASEAAITASRAMDGHTYVTSDLPTFGKILVICNRRDEALKVLRDWVAGPGAHSNQIRFDLIWSRLKDDPRFEEILKSAKPL